MDARAFADRIGRRTSDLHPAGPGQIFFRRQPGILDTHALVWAAEDSPRLGKTVRPFLQGLGREDIGISDLSLLELAMLISKGRLHVKDSHGAQVIAELASRVTVVPV